MITFDNKYEIGNEVRASEMLGTFVVIAIFPRLYQNGEKCISYLCAPVQSGERFWYFREDELSSVSRPARQVNIIVSQKTLFD